jgi:hypothetical protein
MTQFFDALERQLVALSRDAPRMTARVRARRRLAIGTVTLLCLLASVAGTSLLPRGERDATIGAKSMFATLRDRATWPFAPTPSQAIAKGASMLDAGYDAAACGQSVPVRESGRPHLLDVDEVTGRLQGLVCTVQHERRSLRSMAPVVCRDPQGAAVDRFIDEEMDRGQDMDSTVRRGRGRRPCDRVASLHERSP